MSEFLGESEAQKVRSFDALRAYLRRESGLILDADKRYLVESRLSPIIRRESINGLSDLVRILELNQAPRLAQEVVQAMTINETYFFRDRLPFDTLRNEILPELIRNRAAQKSLRIWCAAASTGQEPYSIALIVEELASRMPGWRIDIIGTDLSEAALARAKEGLYSQFEVQRGLSTPQLLRYFNQIRDMWQLKENVRSRVKYRHMNLLGDYGMLGNFDVIFCRNVLIYFDAAKKSEVLNKMTRILAPDGAIFLGAAESVIGLDTKLAPHPKHRGVLVRNTHAQTLTKKQA
ncbi:MAG: protein-glutamate O-methyltransferase CheR [Alphaproteobacteria bacterium]